MSGGREKLGSGSTKSLRAGETTAGRSRRQHRGDAVVPYDAGHLLGESRLVGEIGPPARRRHRQGVVHRLDQSADVRERTKDLDIRVVGPHEADDIAVRQHDRLARGDIEQAGPVWVGPSAGEQHKQFDDAGR